MEDRCLQIADELFKIDKSDKKLFCHPERAMREDARKLQNTSLIIN